MDDLNALFDRLETVEEMMEESRSEVSESFDVEDYMNPFQSYKYDLSEVREGLIRLSGRILAENTKIVNLEEVYGHFKDEEDFDAEDIRDYVRVNYDSKAEEIAKEKIVGKARMLKPLGKEIKIHKNGKMRLETVIEWTDYGGEPLNFYKVMDRLGALERLDLCVNAGWDYAEALETPTQIEGKYDRIRRDSEELLEKQKIRSHLLSIQAVKLHKNGSIHVWTESKGKAEKITDALS